jgi:nitrous oxidase accessory protein
MNNNVVMMLLRGENQMGRKAVSGIMSTLLVISILTLASCIQPAKTSPELPFSDDFNDGVADGWTEGYGKWHVENKEYVASGFGNFTSTVTGLSLTDCIIETRLRFQDTQVSFTAGIIFREIGVDSYYSFDLGKGYNQAWLIFHDREGGGGTGWHYLASVGYPVESNINYTLKVEVNENEFRCHVNGAEVCAANDEHLIVGEVGLNMHNYDSEARTAVAFFDDFKVHSLSGIVVPNDYPTIQEAINQAIEGETIYVKAGTYYENVVVNKTVSLIGEDKTTTIVDGNSVYGGVFNVTAGRVSIQYFSILNGYIGVDVYQGNVMVSDNLITINGQGIVLRGNNNVVQSNIMKCNGGIHLSHFSSNNTIRENQIQSKASYPLGDGIRLQQFNSNNTFVQNEIAGFTAGVWWDGDSYYNLFMENVITDNVWGFFIESWACLNVIKSNTISMNSYDGIKLYWMCGQNTITDNVISNNGQSGICAESCGELTIARNEIINNEVGIKLLGPTEFWKGNNIYHNNFLNNTQQVYINQTLLSKWDNGCEGNRWEDYNGTDTDGDGVGDTFLPWQAVDYYPLMNPYWNLADINHDLKVDGRDIARTAWSFGSLPTGSRWNPHADVNEDSKIDGKDIALVARNFGKTYP